VLGRLIEVVTGKTYETATRELLFGPLGMDHSVFNAAEAIVHRTSVGHQIRDEVPKVVTPWAFPRATTPVGGVVSTVRDLLTYARFHLGDGTAPDGTRLLPPSTARSGSPGSCAIPRVCDSNITAASPSDSKAC
jgi:CubicO group peptidase (beta-lactamase class C family)